MAAALFVGKIHKYQALKFSLQFQPLFYKIMYRDQPKNRVLFSDVVLTYLELTCQHFTANHILQPSFSINNY
jgi:hypothetical protein